jgi:ribosomal 50S subunit-associated protein YjgA (DUF615 family)
VEEKSAGKEHKSQIKREMRALQDLGERLVKLSPGQLKGAETFFKTRLATVSSPMIRSRFTNARSSRAK